MKHLATHEFEVRKCTNYLHDFHLVVEEYATFYSVTFTKYHCARPSVVDYRVKKRFVSGPYSAFKFVYKHFINLGIHF